MQENNRLHSAVKRPTTYFCLSIVFLRNYVYKGSGNGLIEPQMCTNSSRAINIRLPISLNINEAYWVVHK